MKTRNVFNRKNILLFFILFLAFYLLVTFSYYIYVSYRYGYIASTSALSNFTKKYKQTLQTEVFEKAFSMAQKCIEINEDQILQTCRHTVSKQIAQSLHEEELATPEGYDWPNDLFFVKQEGAIMSKLGWEGKLESISTSSRTKVLGNTIWNTLFPPNSNCNYFNSSQTQSESACEYFTVIELGKKQNGYLVRQYPVTEDNYYFLLLVFIPFQALQGQWFALVLLLLPVFLSFCFVYLYCKKRRH